MSILVLGIGNILLSDEGVGVYAVESLRNRYAVTPESVEFLDGGTSGIELLSYLEGKRHLVLIDAVKSGQPPGTVVRIEGPDVPVFFTTKISPHQLGISDLLAVASLSGDLPETMVLFGMEPGSMEPGVGLSAPVQAGFEKLLAAVTEAIREKGGALELRKEPVAVTPGTAFSFGLQP